MALSQGDEYPKGSVRHTSNSTLKYIIERGFCHVPIILYIQVGVFMNYEL